MRTLTNLLAIGLLSFTALHAQESNMSSTVKAWECMPTVFLNSVLEDMVRWLPDYMDYDWNWVTPQGTSHMNRATVFYPSFYFSF